MSTFCRALTDEGLYRGLVICQHASSSVIGGTFSRQCELYGSKSINDAPAVDRPSASGVRRLGT